MFVLFIETAKMALRSIVFCFEILFSFGFWRSNQDAPAAGGRRFGVVSAGRRGGRRRGRGANTPAPFSFFLGGGGRLFFYFTAPRSISKFCGGADDACGRPISGRCRFRSGPSANRSAPVIIFQKNKNKTKLKNKRKTKHAAPTSQ